MKKKKTYRFKHQIYSTNKTKYKRFHKYHKYNLSLMFKFTVNVIFLFIVYLMYSNLIIKINIQTEQKLDVVNIKNGFNYSLKYEEFDENINKQYIQMQNYFCDKQNESLIPEFEKRIKKANADYAGKKFEMFVHTGIDYVSQSIFNSHNWEGPLAQNILGALEYYAKKKNLENKDVYLLDIGCNVGFFTYYLGKYGYKILSFEAWELNNYIIYKNYCLNRDVNVTIINKGLDTEDKKCIMKTSSINQGNGLIICKDRDKTLSDLNGEKIDNIELTKLSRYVKFLSEKNLGAIKMDVEGSEGNVIEGGKELISKYHIPFLLIEYETRMLEAHATKVLEFLEFFTNNGYKISLKNFFSKDYISPNEIVNNTNILNLYMIYEKFLE